MVTIAAGTIQLESLRVSKLLMMAPGVIQAAYLCLKMMPLARYRLKKSCLPRGFNFVPRHDDSCLMVAASLVGNRLAKT